MFADTNVKSMTDYLVAPELSHELLSYFPKILRELCDEIGLEAAQALFTRFRGIRLCIPRSENHEIYNELSNLIGIDKAKHLCQVYGGILLTIPSGAVLSRIHRNAKILKDREAGMAIAKIATKYGLNERTVYNVLR